MVLMISKSKYCVGLQCPKLLWVHYNDRDRLPPFDAGVMARFEGGYSVGELAKSLFPDGVEIEFRSGAYREMSEETARALTARKPIFEAAFLHDGAYAQADILAPVGDDAWDVIEVKSSTGVKPVYVEDVAFQRYCYESAGVKINRCYLFHINNQYVRQGAIDPSQLFTKADITDQVTVILPEVQVLIEQMFEVIAQPECPPADIGPRCSNPYECVLWSECWPKLPDHNVRMLYRLRDYRQDELIGQGIIEIRDVPLDFRLGAGATIQRDCVLSGQPHIDVGAIRAFLDSLTFPQYHLDFETFQSPIPPYDGTRPYQQIPFQFSLHIWRSYDSEPNHVEFLADGNADPRSELLALLKKHIGPIGSVVAYNSTFEEQRLSDAATSFPEYESFVSGLLGRMVDLATPFRSFHYYHPDQRGSASLKRVLPVLFPELSYADMEIGDGGTASSEYARVTFGDVTDEDRENVRTALLKYCQLDTLAMIRIVQVLCRLVG